MLRYVVERRLANAQESLKEYVLGVEVFGRGDAFDPRADGVVRLEALRLRARLRNYYDGEGRAEAVLIELPKGGYSPVFRARALRKTPGGRRWWIFAPAAILLTLAAATVAVYARRQTHRPKLPGASIAVLPFFNLTGDPENDYFDDVRLAVDPVCDGLRGEPVFVALEKGMGLD